MTDICSPSKKKLVKFLKDPENRAATSIEYEIVVIGAGHAGCEAALASARLGCRTLLADPKSRYDRLHGL